MQSLLLAVLMATCLCEHGLSFMMTGSGIQSAQFGISSLSPKPAATRLAPLRKSARTGLQLSVCRFEPGGIGPQKFPMPGSDNTWLALPRVFVLLFNPRTENEGIYTLQITPKDGSMQNTVVLFEAEDDAVRFAGLLEAQDFPMSHVESVEPHEIAAFTEEAGYKTSFIPEGTLFLPPETNVRTSEMRLPSMPWQAHMDEDWLDMDLDFMHYEEEDDDTDYDEVRKNLEELFRS